MGSDFERIMLLGLASSMLHCRSTIPLPLPPHIPLPALGLARGRGVYVTHARALDVTVASMLWCMFVVGMFPLFDPPPFFLLSPSPSPLVGTVSHCDKLFSLISSLSFFYNFYNLKSRSVIFVHFTDSPIAPLCFVHLSCRRRVRTTSTSSPTSTGTSLSMAMAT